MNLDKRDLLTMTILAVLFFSVATWNLGMNQSPITTAQFSAGQSFYIDLGAPTTVKSVVFLLKDGGFNLTVTAGSPDNWNLTSSTSDFSDYYKWREVQLYQPPTTQYLKVDFRATSSNQNAIIAEIAVIAPSNEKLHIASVNSIGSENSNLSNLIDEQDFVQYPADYMSQTYFDEIYFVRTAEQYLHLQFPYEWTHPPLGKLIQAAGIGIFGFNPFGWRIMGVIFATLMIPVLYLLGKRLFGTWIGAFASAFLLAFDFMHFAMGRMGTADTYVVFFSLLSQLCFLLYFTNVIKNGWKTSVVPLFLAVVFFTLGFSSKWIVLYGAVGMLVMLAALRIKDIRKLKGSILSKYAAFFDHPFLLLLGFIGAAVVIYFATYIPDMIIGRPIIGTYGNGVVDLQFAMYNYHSTLPVSHGIAWDSPWWSWPFMMIPLWLEGAYLPNNGISTIMDMGNPAVWWIGFACVILITEKAINGKELASSLWRKITKKRQIPQENLPSAIPTNLTIDETAHSQQTLETKPPARTWDIAAIFIATLFFFQWLPYILISRITYIYHFYVNVPILCLASAYFLNGMWNKKWGKVVTIAYLAIVVAVFVIFFNVISGFPTSRSWVDTLKLLGGTWLRP